LNLSPAIGKSQIVSQLCEKYNLKMIDLRLSQCDPLDLQGMISVNEDRNLASYIPMDTFPTEDTPLPEGKAGWVLFLDEANSASLSIQAAAFKLVLDRMVWQYKLHSKVFMVCAGNLSTDKGITTRLSTPMQSRLAHFELKPDITSWIDWADISGIDYRIKAYLQFKPEMLYKFDPKHNDHTFASPRTWEFASRLIKDDELTENSLVLMSSVVSEGVAREFYSYTKIFKELPNIESIIKNPDTTKVPDEPSILYAVSGLISHHLNTGNAKQLMKYLRRINIEFAIICLTSAAKRDASLLKQDDIVDFKVDHMADFI